MWKCSENKIRKAGNINDRRKRAIAIGCEDQHKTPVPEERTCPVCGKDIEVFVVKGRVVEDAVCDCGYVIKADEAE